jgi:hypothetical protein
LISGANETSGKALTELGSQFGVEHGLAFTLILAALFVPAWAILRRRAWQVAHTAMPEATFVEQDKWLTDRKMAFTVYQHFGQWLAILAPVGPSAGASTIVTLFGQ